VKGMPTGIAIPTPATRSQSSWPQMFMLFEDRLIKFDIGRKALRGRQSSLIKGYAKNIFSEYERLFKYISGDGNVTPARWDRDSIFREIHGVLDIVDPNSRLKFQKTPRDQEASVFAIFFELLGLGVIHDIVPLSAGYRKKYDLYARWGERNVVIEFKSKLKNILLDFDEERKMFDEQILQNAGIVIHDVEQNAWGGGGARPFPNSTHILSLPNVNSVHVIDLKLIIERAEQLPVTAPKRARGPRISR
jgi:hypothetical protein